METIGYLADVDDGRIAPGMKVRCILDTYPDRVFNGKVEEVAAIADTRRGFRVRISMEGSDPAIMRPGMSVRAEVVRRAWDRALTVPRQALRRGADGGYVAKAGSSAPIPVRVAACTPTDCVIESGLREGDHVQLR
jgi:multidrug efflux pump subunit AcrA (membrane-fusion protein)